MEMAAVLLSITGPDLPLRIIMRYKYLRRSCCCSKLQTEMVASLIAFKR